MVARKLFFAASAALLAHVPVHAEGRLGTLPQGRYLCELPGDATGPASIPVPSAWFDIVNASSYRAEGGAGTYLLTEKTIVFTRGPMKGARFVRTGQRALERTDLAGRMADLRCVRTGRSAS